MKPALGQPIRLLSQGCFNNGAVQALRTVFFMTAAAALWCTASDFVTGDLLSNGIAFRDFVAGQKFMHTIDHGHSRRVAGYCAGISVTLAASEGFDNYLLE
jgi:hypothetical protein